MRHSDRTRCGFSGALGSLALGLAATAHAQLSASGALIEDPSDNLTWVANANLMATQASSYSGGAAAYVSAVMAASGGVIHDTPNPADVPANSGTYPLSTADFNAATGKMTWWGAQAWVNYLNSIGYQGFSDWRLPATVDAGSSQGYPNGAAGNPAVTSSELAELFYGQLGQVAGQSIQTTHDAAYGLFSNMELAYPSATEWSAAPSSAWSFGPSVGAQEYGAKANLTWALAVRTGIGGPSAGDGPLPLWALGLLGSALGAIALRRLNSAQEPGRLR